MSEIERAIEYIESMFPIDEQEGEALSAALKALRAELDREKNEPLTIDDLDNMIGEPVWNDWNNQYGILAEYCGQLVIQCAIDWMWVNQLIKDGKKFYRYEPKGEKA